MNNQEERKILQGKSEERYVSVNEINRDNYNGSRDKLTVQTEQKENDPFTANLISQLVNGTNIQQMIQ